MGIPGTMGMCSRGQPEVGIDFGSESGFQRHMKIQSISVYQVDLPLIEGRYTWGDGCFVENFDSTVVEIQTDEGLSGWGEVCPLGPNYLPAFASGARAGIQQIAPHLLDRDPTEPGVIYQEMNRALKGHPYAKSAIDMACWDLLGKASGQPVWKLLGGRFADSHPLYRAISQESPQAMAKKVHLYREEGYRQFQLKVGGDPSTDIQRIHEIRSFLDSGETLVADANTGWRTHEARRVVKQVEELDVYLEQPCASYEECLAIRQATRLPMILDECITDLSMLARAVSDRALDAVNLKIGRLGGITPWRACRDFCLEAGIPMTIEDAWGSDLVTAAISHLAISTPPELLFSATDFNGYVSVRTTTGAPRREAGRLSPGYAAGLGVTPLEEVLGEPFYTVS